LGLRLRYEHRVKEVPSLVKKALTKNVGYADVVDKAGVRIIYGYRWELDAMEGVLASEFVVLKREDMSERLKPTELDYLGIHFDLRLKDEDIAPLELTVEPTCEVQLHSWQQDTWAHYSHDLLYKAHFDTPRGIARSLHRLLAMVEIFDQEVNVARSLLLESPGFEMARLLDQLERELFRYVARDYDPNLTKSLVGVLVPLYSGRDINATLHAFVAEHDAKLERIYSTYHNDPRATPLLFQPEALLIFAALEEFPSGLESAFVKVAPPELLAELALVWGFAI